MNDSLDIFPLEIWLNIINVITDNMSYVNLLQVIKGLNELDIKQGIN